MLKRSLLHEFLAITPLVYAQEVEDLKAAEWEFKERVAKNAFEANPKAYHSLASWSKNQSFSARLLAAISSLQRLVSEEQFLAVKAHPTLQNSIYKQAIAYAEKHLQN